eukprot:365535-Chlamydomonas_euryale.AAC.83
MQRSAIRRHARLLTRRRRAALRLTQPWPECRRQQAVAPHTERYAQSPRFEAPHGNHRPRSARRAHAERLQHRLARAPLTGRHAAPRAQRGGCVTVPNARRVQPRRACCSCSRLPRSPRAAQHRRGVAVRQPAPLCSLVLAHRDKDAPAGQRAPQHPAGVQPH